MFEEVLELVALLGNHVRRARLDLVDVVGDDGERAVHAFEGEGVVGVDFLDEEGVVVRVRVGEQDRAFLEELHVVLDFVLETLGAAGVALVRGVVVELVFALHDLFAAEAHPDLLPH